MPILEQHVLGSPGKVDYMPFSSIIENNPPDWYLHVGWTNVIFADDGSAFLIDFGSPKAIDRINALKKDGRLKNVDGIFVSHIHNDHTDGIDAAAKEFGCPVYATKELEDVLENPSASHLPCLTTDPIDITVVGEGQKMNWKDFTLTFYYFPGQTYYHDAVLIEKKGGESIFFIGDTFTPAGIDDYCLLNRNLLHPGMGYLYCLEFLKKFPENTLLCNQHFNTLFAFSTQQIDRMIQELRNRNAMLTDLLPWDNINYGVDEQWAILYPYGQVVQPGQTVEFSIRIFNHSQNAMKYSVKPNVPEGYTVEPKEASIMIEPLKEGMKTFNAKVPADTKQGIDLLTADLKFGDWDLHEWCEAIIEIK
jgi:glyoxylase-like metal-dependent hydrolase (beta-lactamase superfamily II)